MSRKVKVDTTQRDADGQSLVVIRIDGKEVYRKAGDLSFLPGGVSHPGILLALVEQCLMGGAR